jgi:hypothetical protein
MIEGKIMFVVRTHAGIFEDHAGPFDTYDQALQVRDKWLRIQNRYRNDPEAQENFEGVGQPFFAMIEEISDEGTLLII